MKRAFPTKLILSLTMALIFCISFGYYNLDEDITNTGVSLQRNFSSFGQGIEKIVFMISGDRDDPNNITMQLQGNTIVVDKAFTAGSPTNTMEGVVTDSTIVGGTDNKITTGTANSLAGGQGNKISGSNSVIMGGSGNVINANTGIIMGGQENKITNAKAIIFGSHNEVTGKVSQSTDLENVILGNHIKLTNEGSGENVLMGSGYEFQGEKSFVRSTAGNKLSGSKTVIIDSPNGMIIQTGEAHGSALTMLGNFLLSSKGTGDIDTNETGAVKTITHCNCYNDGTQWYSVQNTAACNLLCDKKVAECSTQTGHVCEAGDVVNINHDNVKGNFWGCEGTSGSILVSTQCVICNTGFDLTGSNLGPGHWDCIPHTQTGICENKKNKDNPGVAYYTSEILQTRSGTLQAFVPSTQAVYKSHTGCSFACTGGYYYKNVTDTCTECPIGKWSNAGAISCTSCSDISHSDWMSFGTNSNDCKYSCHTGYHDMSPTRECHANTGSIRYNLNGGTHGSLSDATSWIYDTGFTVSNPTRVGYTFEGWLITGMDTGMHYYTDAGGNTEQNTVREYTTKAVKFKNLTAQNNGSINFSANWTPNWYTVTLVDDNKAYPTSGAVTAGTTQYHYQYQTRNPCYYYTISGNTSSANCLPGDGEKIDLPTRAGYNFQGYFTQTGGKGTGYVNNEGLTINNIYKNIAGNTTLYAYWTPKCIHISLEKNGSNEGTSDIYYRYHTNRFYSDRNCNNQITSVLKPSLPGNTFIHYYGDGTRGGNPGKRYVKYKTVEFAGDLHYEIWDNATLTALYCPNCAPGEGASCSVDTNTSSDQAICTYTTSCKNGYESLQNTGTYNPSCTPKSCPQQGACGRAAHGFKCMTYSTDPVSCYSSCKQLTATCEYGTWKGSIGTSSPTCTKQCSSCPAKTINYYTNACETTSSSVTLPETSHGSDPLYLCTLLGLGNTTIYFRCDNGTWVSDAGNLNATLPIGAYGSCRGVTAGSCGSSNNGSNSGGGGYDEGCGALEKGGPSCASIANYSCDGHDDHCKAHNLWLRCCS